MLEPGFRRKENTTFTIPWVFKRSNDSKRLHAFVGHVNGSVFKGENFGAKEQSTIHITISDNGNNKLSQNFYLLPKCCKVSM